MVYTRPRSRGEAALSRHRRSRKIIELSAVPSGSITGASCSAGSSGRTRSSISATGGSAGSAVIVRRCAPVRAGAAHHDDYRRRAALL
jgi:hypothetical protein